MVDTSASSDTITDLRFPGDLVTMDHWMRISSFKYSRASRDAVNAVNAAFTGHVFLPVPSKLSANYSSEYSNKELGITGKAQEGAVGIYKDIKGIFDSTTAGKERNKAIADQISAAGGVMMANSPGAVTNWMLDEFPLSGYSVAAGVARNPHMAVLFQGVDFRSFHFDWEFVPRDKAELDTIRSIITHFKRARAPQYQNTYANHLFSYPDEFQIELHYPDYLFTFGACVLVDFSVDYSAPRGTRSFFRDPKAPIVYNLSLKFQEVEIITRESIDAYNR